MPNYQLPGPVALLHEPESWGFIPEIRGRGRDAEKSPPVSQRQVSFVEPGLQGGGLWAGGAGRADSREPKSTPTLSEYKHLLRGT